MAAYQMTLILAFLLGMAELLSGSFLFLGMAIGAVAVALLQWLWGDFSVSRDVLVFALVASVSFWLCRRWVARSTDHATAKEDVNQY